MGREKSFSWKVVLRNYSNFRKVDAQIFLTPFAYIFLIIKSNTDIIFIFKYLKFRCFWTGRVNVADMQRQRSDKNTFLQPNNVLFHHHIQYIHYFLRVSYKDNKRTRRTQLRPMFHCQNKTLTLCLLGSSSGTKGRQR